MKMRSIKAMAVLGIMTVGLLVGCGKQSEQRIASGDSHAATQVISGSVAGLSQEELAERSCLVVIGTVTDSESFLIQPATGADASIFTDYTVKASDILRGEAVSEEIFVRVQGGTTGTMITSADAEPELENEKTYLLFLYKPEHGGGYNTEGDYYYVTGAFQGAYEIDPASEICINTNDHETKWSLTDARETIERMNEQHPADVNYMRELGHENMRANVESGMMTQEEYDRAIAEEQEYAVIVK